MKHGSYKEAILRTATIMFAEKGYRDTSVGDIARVVGSAEATIFHHFKSKEGLFLACFDRVRNRIVDEVETLRSERFEHGLARVQAIMALFFHLSRSMRVEFLLLMHWYPYQLACTNERCNLHLEAIYGCFLDVLEEAMEEGQRDGSIRRGDPRAQSMLVFSLVNGLVRFTLLNLLPATTHYSEAIEACEGLIAAH
jgi:AcrR family transcriptional regulator